MSTWMIVGADKGIGRAMAVQVAERGDHVYAACLGDGRDLDHGGITVVPDIDVTSDTAMAALATALEKAEALLDCVVHVAGVLGIDTLGQLDYEDVRRQIEINAVGPLRTIEAIRSRLAPAAKVGIITSRVGSLNDNGSGGMYAYRMSKAAANMVGLNLHHDLSKRGICVLLLHPGMVLTDLTKDIPDASSASFIQPDEAAAGLIRNMDNLTPATSGKFQHSNGEYLPW